MSNDDAFETNPISDDMVADVEAAAHRLLELNGFASVVIGVTRVQDGRTQRQVTQVGNWYATQGAMREWLVQQDEDAREKRRER